MRTPTITVPKLNYRQVRARWCLAVIRALVKRWLAYIILAIAMLGAFSVGATTSMAAMTAWTVLPVFKAASMPWWQALPCWMAQVLVGTAIVLAWRPVLWPEDWRSIEKAFPIRPGELWRSDVAMVTVALAPLFAVYLAGGLTWTVQAPPWLDHLGPRAWGLLISSMACSLGLGTFAVLLMRRPPRPTSRGPEQTALAKRPSAELGTGALMALWVLPLQRGPAKRSGRLLVLHALGVLALCGLTAAANRRWAPWTLAAFTFAALSTTTRLRSVIDTELAPLHEACRPMPLSEAILRWQRRALSLLPASVGLLCLPIALHVNETALRSGLAASFMAFSVLGHAWQAFHHSRRSRNQATSWMFTLVVLLALASEVFA
ncbi:hypothetical protein [Aquabacterium sp.]|uniref:hypothetical protein n=1 Tax=Aquabacterium sp. TaxID=1872578 RepID=UPI003D6D3705